jgi:hypothetical protein
MADLESIKENYKGQSNYTLIQLSKKPEELRREVIQILMQELDNRGLKTESDYLSDYLSGKVIGTINPYKDLSIEEINEMIQERLQAGESLESIRWDLKDHGITGFNLLHKENEERENAFKQMDKWKEEGLSAKEIESKLQESYDFNEDGVKHAVGGYKKSGKVLIISGFILSILALLMIFLDYFSQSNIRISPLLLLLGGITTIFSGYSKKV